MVMDDVFSSAGDWGLLILRLALGATFLVHGRMKIKSAGLLKGAAGFAGWLSQMGVPLAIFFAWVVILLETAGAMLLAAGLGTRVLALGFAIDMLFAILLAKRRMMKARFMDDKVQGWEFEFSLMSSSLALVFLGAGAFGLDRVLGA
jgi:putative oxidoreductase